MGRYDGSPLLGRDPHNQIRRHIAHLIQLIRFTRARRASLAATCADLGACDQVLGKLKRQLSATLPLR